MKFAGQSKLITCSILYTGATIIPGGSVRLHLHVMPPKKKVDRELRQKKAPVVLQKKKNRKPVLAKTGDKPWHQCAHCLVWFGDVSKHIPQRLECQAYYVRLRLECDNLHILHANHGVIEANAQTTVRAAANVGGCEVVRPTSNKVGDHPSTRG